MKTQPCLVIPGTWAADPDEVDPYFGQNGTFVRFLQTEGWISLNPGDPLWTTNMEGGICEKVLGYFFGGAEASWHRDWIDGGNHIHLKLSTLPYEVLAELVIICHSHGLQAVLYALAQLDTQIKGLISVASPDRLDMREKQVEAALRVRMWLHLQMGARKDHMSWLGTIGSGGIFDTFGGAFGLTLGPEPATRRDKLKEFDHSEILTDESLYYLWPERLRAVAAA